MNLLFSLFIVLTIIANPVKVLSDEIVLAGGCFWCLEHDIEYLDGVKSVTSGYSGGDLENPTYENHKGHQEVVLVKYNPRELAIEELLRLYFRNIDPLDGKGQFCDRGDSYRPVIFFEDQISEQKVNDALKSASKELEVPFDKIKVEIKSRSKFWIAEDYHQDYANNNEIKYKFYRYSCGRDKRLNQIWGDNARSTKVWQE